MHILCMNCSKIQHLLRVLDKYGWKIHYNVEKSLYSAVLAMWISTQSYNAHHITQHGTETLFFM